MPKVKKGKAHVPSASEMTRLFKIVSVCSFPKRDTLLIWLSYGLGLRVMELAALKLNQLFNDDESINECISLVTTKDNKQRTVYLPNYMEDDRIHKALRAYLKERKELAAKKKLPFSLQQPVFLSQKGGSFSARSLQHRFDVLYKQAGIHGASSHSGRRTFATRLIEEGADLKAVSVLMGHSTVAMTAEYVEHNPMRLKKMAQNAIKFL